MKELGFNCVKTSITKSEDAVTYRINLSGEHKDILKFLRYMGYRYDNHKVELTYLLHEYLISKANRIGIEKSVSRCNSFPLYEQWINIYTLDNIAFDETISIKKIDYNDKLYGLCINDTHNYIADEFITKDVIRD